MLFRFLSLSSFCCFHFRFSLFAYRRIFSCMLGYRCQLPVLAFYYGKWTVQEFSWGTLMCLYRTIKFTPPNLYIFFNRKSSQSMLIQSNKLNHRVICSKKHMRWFLSLRVSCQNKLADKKVSIVSQESFDFFAYVYILFFRYTPKPQPLLQSWSVFSLVTRLFILLLWIPFMRTDYALVKYIIG